MAPHHQPQAAGSARGHAPPCQDRGNPVPGQPLEGLGLVGEEDGAVREEVPAPIREALKPCASASGGGVRRVEGGASGKAPGSGTG